MSERRYYLDAYTTTFTATIVDRIRHKGKTAVVLDHTYFYPTSGGQPFDCGTINQIAVTDVTIRDQDEAILHWVATSIAEDTVTAAIDWSRRFDHMQQHTGQHILSQAFLRTLQAPTVGFHLSDDSVTIDLELDELTAAAAARAEQVANDIVWQNRLVHIHMVPPQQAAQMSLRKIPPLKSGLLRLIDVEDFDLTACGGTHVLRTGEVGLIKVVKVERRGAQWRVEFRCGRRALADYAHKNGIVNQLTGALTTGMDELVAAVNRLQENVKESQRTFNRQQTQLLALEAERLLQQGASHGATTIITHVFTGRDPKEVRTLGAQLAQSEGVVALLAVVDPKLQLIFCRAADAPGHMNELLQAALQALGAGAGGGSATFAQGGGPPVAPERVRELVDRARQQLVAQL